MNSHNIFDINSVPLKSYFFAGFSKPSNDRNCAKLKLNKLSNKVKSKEKTLNVIDSNITDYSIKYDQCSTKMEQVKTELKDCNEALKDKQNEKDMMKGKCANLKKKGDDIAQQKNQTNNKIANILKLIDSLKQLPDVQKEMAASSQKPADRLESLKTAQLPSRQRLDGESLV